jgi:hypothetical protein
MAGDDRRPTGIGRRRAECHDATPGTRPAATTTTTSPQKKKSPWPVWPHGPHPGRRRPLTLTCRHRTRARAGLVAASGGSPCHVASREVEKWSERAAEVGGGPVGIRSARPRRGIAVDSDGDGGDAAGWGAVIGASREGRARLEIPGPGRDTAGSPSAVAK